MPADHLPDSVAVDPYVRDEVSAAPIFAGDGGALFELAADEGCPAVEPHLRFGEVVGREIQVAQGVSEILVSGLCIRRC